MSLLFGRLVQAFVNFGTALQAVDPNDPASEATLAAAASYFKHQAALDASYLVYIGKEPPSVIHPATNRMPFADIRYRILRLYVRLYVYLGVHRRDRHQAASREIPSSCPSSGHCLL